MQLLFLLLLLLVLHGASSSSVSGCCRDRDKDHRWRENCTGAGFSHIPAGLEQQTQVLLFPLNLFTALSWTSFQIFPDVYEIDLTANQVPEVTPSSAPVLPSLSVLRLGSNRLSSLPDGSFAACPALTELYLENNSLVSLSDGSFSGLSSLEILDLTANQISVLPDLMLHPLSAIETLYLENNKIRVMPDDWFSQKEEVPYLYLSENPWFCSCSLGYLRRYLENYELNVYVRDGPLIKIDVDSVVCGSPQWHQRKPVMSLEESDLCPPSYRSEEEPLGDFYLPVITAATYKMTLPSSTTTSTPETPTIPYPSSVASMAPSIPEPSTPHLIPEEELVTLDWSQTFTSRPERSSPSRSKITTGRSAVRRSTQTIPLIPSTAGPSTTPIRKSTDVLSTRTSATLQTLPAASTTGTLLVSNQSVVTREHFRVSSAGGGAAFCVWLFAGSLVLCVASAACVLVTVARLIVCYRKLYRPLSLALARRAKGGAGVPLLGKEGAVAGDGGVVALYRSLLFVSREGGNMAEERDGGQVVTVQLIGGGGAPRGAYRKTMYRVVSKEEEIEGWREVVEECRVPAEDGGRRRDAQRDEEPPGGAGGGGAGGGVSKKRYSVILREEAGGGREELDWVVGGWEVKRGAEEGPRSSWGAWLAEYLPSMPWGVSAPSEEEEVEAK